MTPYFEEKVLCLLERIAVALETTNKQLERNAVPYTLHMAKAGSLVDKQIEVAEMLKVSLAPTQPWQVVDVPLSTGSPLLPSPGIVPHTGTISCKYCRDYDGT
jgi:hypothetical protein